MPRTESRGIPYASALLARLLTCRAAGVSVSQELLDQVIAAFDSEVTARKQQRHRNKLIRRAGLLLPEMSEYARAGCLAQEARALPRARTTSLATSPRPPAATVRECLLEASIYGRLPASRRQFLRLLQLSQPAAD